MRYPLLRSSLLFILLASSPAMAGAQVGPAPDGESFSVTTDSVPAAQIVGEVWRVPQGVTPRGTLFMCHGFARSMWDTRDYRWIAEREHWNVVRFDFREHGASSHRAMDVPTLGYHEIWDLKAVIDHAEQNGLAHPYACYGHSMGAAIALRWAGTDRRIVGVLAQSPFRNALDATGKFRRDDARVQIATALLLRKGMRGMLEQVDIPAAVALRDDLRVWLTAGEHDYFDETDQRAILSASRSPDELKRVVIIPGGYHGDHWRWAGNDPLIREFIDEVSPRSVAFASPHARRASRIVPAVAVVASGVAGVGYFFLRRYRRSAA